MRASFVQSLTRAVEDGLDAYLISGDLGFGVFDDFRARFPDRFVNPGVAEQQMTSLAAGMALTGAVCFTYSIANFATLRCLEQLRNDICYTRAHVIAVAVGGGLAYGQLGATHHATEDLAIMCALPGMRVAAPGDPLEVDMVMRSLIDEPGPGYLRLGKSSEPTVHTVQPSVAVGELVRLRHESSDRVLVVTTGALLPLGAALADDLVARGVPTRHWSAPWLSPVNAQSLDEALDGVDLVVTLEEHVPVGGLYGVMSEHVARRGGPRVLPFALPHAFLSTVGDRDYLLASVGLVPDRMADSVLAVLAPV